MFLFIIQLGSILPQKEEVETLKTWLQEILKSIQTENNTETLFQQLSHVYAGCFKEIS